MIRRRLLSASISLVLFVLAVVFAIPIVVVFVNSFMDGFEIFNRFTHSVEPGNMQSVEGNIHFVRLTFIPDRVTLSQYIRLFFDNPLYLGRFWNSVALV